MKATWSDLFYNERALCAFVSIGSLVVASVGQSLPLTLFALKPNKGLC
jgi:hypothetical protein